jgi:hypothetical protein
LIDVCVHVFVGCSSQQEDLTLAMQAALKRDKLCEVGYDVSRTTDPMCKHVRV